MILSVPFAPKSKVMVKIGDKIDLTTILYKENTSEELKLPISQNLGVSPDKIFKYLKKFVGEELKKGELIAEKKSFLNQKKVRSEHDSLIKEINHTEGYVLLEIKTDKLTGAASHIRGEVVGIDKDKIKIEVDTVNEYNLKEDSKTDSEFGGAVFYLPKGKSDFLGEQVEGKVVAVETLTAYELVKLEALGAIGFVTLHTLPQETQLPYARLKQITDWEKLVKEKLTYCIVNRKDDRIYFYN